MFRLRASPGNLLAVQILAIAFLFVAITWLMSGGIFAFFGRMARQGLAAGSNKTVQDLTMRQERWAGKTASIMFRRLWPIPLISLVGFILIAANYKV